MMCFRSPYISWQRSHSSHLLFVIFTLLLIKSFLSLSFFSCSCHCRFISLYKGPCHTHKVQRLNESTSYTFRIQAFNEAGEGPFSNVYTFTTPRSPPAPVKGTVAALFLFFSFFFARFLSPSCILSFFPSISHTHTLPIYLSLSLFSRCGSALFTNTHCWHTDSQCAQLLTSVDPSLTCIWSRPSGASFTCRLSSWVGLFSAALRSQPASAKPLLILHVEVSNEDVGFILSAAPL